MRPWHRCADRQMAAEDHCHRPHSPTTSLSSLLSQDFLKYSKKASLDTSELEVSCGPAVPLQAPCQHGVWSWCGVTSGGGVESLCPLWRETKIGGAAEV